VLHTADAQRGVELARVCDLDVAMVAAGPNGEAGARIVTDLQALGGAPARTPVLAMIDGEGEDAEACLAAGARAILRKPANAPALARALSEALAASPLAVEAANDRWVA